MRWKIRCTDPVARAQHIKNKRGKAYGSFPSLTALIVEAFSKGDFLFLNLAEINRARTGRNSPMTSSSSGPGGSNPSGPLLRPQQEEFEE